MTGIIHPQRHGDAGPFWTALDDGRLLVARCGGCHHRWLPPTRSCPRCASASVDFDTAAALGHLYTWTVIHLAVDPVYADDAPYIVGLVELDDGARLYGRILDIEREALRVDLPLAVEVGRVGGQALWHFRPTR